MISNKGQLTNLYNRNTVETKRVKRNSNNLNNPKVLNEIHRECDKPIANRWYVKAHSVFKANDYDIVKTSMKNCKLQRKYNSSNFEEIKVIEEAKLNYDNLSIMQLQNMITVDNEPYIMKLIARKMKEQEQIIAEHEVERLKEKVELKERKARNRATTVMKLRGLYTVPSWQSNNYGRLVQG